MSIENSTLALAGMFQSAELVRQIARQGLLDLEPFEASILSLLKIDAESVGEVYGGLAGVKIGLQTCCEQLGNGSQRYLEVMHYVLGMIILERKLMKRQDMLEDIKTGIEAIQVQINMSALSHPDVIKDLADLYMNTLSKFDFRLKINGERRFLENPSNANKIRALLLAGVRSTVLWRQKKGNRLQLIFSRGKILRTTQQFLEHIKQPSDQ